jgi:hypothetical protein
MAQQKKLTPENLDKELAALKDRQIAADEMKNEAWRKLDEAENAKAELQRRAILLQTAKEMMGEPIKAQVAYAKGLAAGKGIVLDDDPQESLVELLSQFKAQDAVEAPVAAKAPAAPKKGRPAKVETPAKVEKPTKVEKPAEVQPEKRKRRTKAEMEAARAAEAAAKGGVPIVSPAAAMANLAEPIVEEFSDGEQEFDDGDYDD